jgi:WhiB family transcriptional regulator, redox-sensing transcriptional regulator
MAERRDRRQGADLSGYAALVSGERPHWQARAACRGRGELFFAVGRDPETAAAKAEAKAICESCPVLDACREYGQSEKFGVWGGMSLQDRKRVRRVARTLDTSQSP